MSDMRVALVASLDDRLVAPLRRSLDTVERNLKEVERELTGVGRAGQKAGDTLQRMSGPQQATRQAAQLARETERATRLADRLRESWNRASQMVRGVAAGVAAFQAARMVVSGPLQQARSYDRALADAANTAFADRNTAGRIAGMRELDAAVTAAVRAGGGSRDDTLNALNEMLASGAVSAAQTKNLLPVINRYATAGNASVTDISTIVIRALQSGFKEADIPRLLDMALAAGQAGGFELKDMARWLPKLMAAGQNAGITGVEGFGRILASAQGAVTTAGSKDEAGNNLLNLLLKLNSADTAADAKKLGIDLAGSLAAAREKGVNALDAFVNLVDQIAAKDSRLVALRQRAAAAGSDEERRAALDAQRDILQGSAIGQILQDRQALMPLIAELNRRDYIADVRRQVAGASGQYGAANFELISQTADYRIRQKDNEAQFAQTRALDGANAGLGRLAEVTADLYRKYPELAAAMEGTKLSVTALAAAAAAASGALLLLGGAKGAGRLLGGAAAARGAAGAATAAKHVGIFAAGGSAPAAAAAVPSALATAGAIGATAAGAAVVGAPILAAGLYLDKRANSPEGLRARISTRNTRIDELDELLRLQREAGGSEASLTRLANERAQLAADRDKLLAKSQATGDGAELTRLMQRSVDAQEKNAAALKELAERPLQVTMDGHALTDAINERNAREARRN